MDWITDRKPQESDFPNYDGMAVPVLVQYKDTIELEVIHYSFYTKKFVFAERDFTDNILAWKKLPKPYIVNDYELDNGIWWEE